IIMPKKVTYDEFSMGIKMARVSYKGVRFLFNCQKDCPHLKDLKDGSVYFTPYLDRIKIAIREDGDTGIKAEEHVFRIDDEGFLLDLKGEMTSLNLREKSEGSNTSFIISDYIPEWNKAFVERLKNNKIIKTLLNEPQKRAPNSLYGKLLRATRAFWKLNEFSEGDILAAHKYFIEVLGIPSLTNYIRVKRDVSQIRNVFYLFFSRQIEDFRNEIAAELKGIVSPSFPELIQGATDKRIKQILEINSIYIREFGIELYKDIFPETKPLTSFSRVIKQILKLYPFPIEEGLTEEERELRELLSALPPESEEETSAAAVGKDLSSPGGIFSFEPVDKRRVVSEQDMLVEAFGKEKPEDVILNLILNGVLPPALLPQRLRLHRQEADVLENKQARITPKRLQVIEISLIVKFELGRPDFKKAIEEGISVLKIARVLFRVFQKAKPNSLFVSQSDESYYDEEAEQEIDEEKGDAGKIDEITIGAILNSPKLRGKIKALYEGTGMNMQKFCRWAGVDYTALSCIIRGETKWIEPFTLDSLALGFGMSISQLLSENVESTSSPLAKPRRAAAGSPVGLDSDNLLVFSAGDLEGKFCWALGKDRKRAVYALNHGLWPKIVEACGEIKVSDIKEIWIVYAGKGINWEPRGDQQVFEWLKERYPAGEFNENNPWQLWAIYRNVPIEFVLKFILADDSVIRATFKEKRAKGKKGPRIETGDVVREPPVLKMPLTSYGEARVLAGRVNAIKASTGNDAVMAIIRDISAFLKGADAKDTVALKLALSALIAIITTKRRHSHRDYITNVLIKFVLKTQNPHAKEALARLTKVALLRAVKRSNHLATKAIEQLGVDGIRRIKEAKATPEDARILLSILRKYPPVVLKQPLRRVRKLSSSPLSRKRPINSSNRIIKI
ncbi:MAG: hypothetical protein WAW67_01885, partial [Candidatus Omnitrophota bacterium]